MGDYCSAVLIALGRIQNLNRKTRDFLQFGYCGRSLTQPTGHHAIWGRSRGVESSLRRHLETFSGDIVSWHASHIAVGMGSERLVFLNLTDVLDDAQTSRDPCAEV
jgi:hypothetical protein